ncbi:GNAT family N-acetyltransferase [Aquicoccus sp. G2-2]|uniref:GNAT family N-acetyltransferase n=1 Tax=Aquicoccus sp. G2-2 TaxID=3092120 RepID=UPI002ADF73F7|nr:GNAT family N-acetyltransferase [Aquicoccus sp. G2-2]MEA1115162.1 GNAT family N-acetyltransferase [Aquicoccus sp. G2-2]
MTTAIPTLETERLILREPREADFAHERDFYQSDESRFVGGPKTPEATWRSLAMLMGHWAFRGFGFWGLEDKATHTYQGRVGLWFPHGWKGREIGWTLMPHARGRGYATEAALAARAHAYDILGWDTAISLIAAGNAASKAVARRLGAAHESTFEDEDYGPVEIWRHRAPSEIADGGMEAYA